MSSRPTRSTAASRAEARRRARLAARGELDETSEEASTNEAPDEPRGGFLSRIFPPAPPLPGRPDPLRGFNAEGGMRPVRERLFLLRANPWAWIPTGIVAFIGMYASIFYQGGLLGLIATFVQFGALIAAGWFGWQRPTLYGTTAGVMSGVLTSIFVLVGFANVGATPDVIGPETVVLNVAIQILYQAAFGFLGGWYGGYLRRRQAQLSSQVRRR